MNILLSQKITTSIEDSLKIYRQIIKQRNDSLFTTFLPIGYQYTTLSSVDTLHYENVIIAKFHVGMLITLLDDFADNPQYFNVPFLQKYHFLSLHNFYIPQNISQEEHNILQLIHFLLNTILTRIQYSPHYHTLINLLEFDLQRFYQANYFAGLVTEQPALIYSDELLQLRPFNMEIIIAGLLDIMASPHFLIHELGSARNIFHLAQRYGSICNNINTFWREYAENDITNEIIAKGIQRKLINPEKLKSYTSNQLISILSPIEQEMLLEQNKIIQQIMSFADDIQSFNIQQYIDGLSQLKYLHESMQGSI